MAIGFIPKETAEYSIEGVQEAIVVAAMLHVLHQGQFHVELEGERFLIADRSSAMSAGHTLELKWNETALSIVCKLNGNFTDFGTSKKVLEKFLINFKVALENLSIEEIHQWNAQYYAVLDKFRNDSGKDQFKWWYMFVPGKGALVTPVIFWINTLVFLLMQFDHLGFWDVNGEVLIKWGANFGPLTLKGEWWRLFTCIFLHGGFLHYAMNSFSLMVLGFALERIIRANIFAFIYILSGITASLVSLWWHSYQSSVGASGAIFGMMGALLALQLTSLITDESGKSQISTTLTIIGLNLLFGLKEGIDNAAHVGGLICGLAVGLVLAYTVKKKKSLTVRYLSLLIPSGLVLLFSAWAIPPLKRDALKTEISLKRYEEIQNAYVEREKELVENLDLLNRSDMDVRDKYAFAEQKRSGYEELLHSLDSVSSKDLPNYYTEKYVLLRRYTQNRIRFFETYKAYFSPGGENNLQELKRIQGQRDSLLNILNSNQ